MADAENGKFKAVIVTKLDRFGRSLKELVNSTDRLRELGIDFISLGDSIDTSTPNGKLLFNMLCAFAEFERELTRERLASGREKAKLEGKSLHRPLKELDERQIKRWYLENRLSINAISKLCKCSPATISNRLRRMGVEIRP
nr:hypothetical protein 8 [bacterium]